MTGLEVGLLFYAAFATACSLMLGTALWQRRRVRAKTDIEELEANSGWVVLKQTHECNPPDRVDPSSAGLGSRWACGGCGSVFEIERWYGSQRGQPMWKRIKKGNAELL